MASLDCRPRIGITITLSIDEGEARFLDAIVGYGADQLIGAVKDKLGKAYIEGHERDGVRFCETVRQMLPAILSKLADARNAFDPKVKDPKQ